MSPAVGERLTRVTRDAVVVEVRGPLGPVGARLLCARVEVLLTGHDVICELTGTPDLGVVETVARMALLAKRRGRRVTLSGSDHGLLALTGLEVLGQAEAGEQSGVEEVMDVLDPPV